MSCGQIGEGSCDFPGQCKDPEYPKFGTVTLRTVTDADTGEVLCSACNGCKRVSPAVGQRIDIEDLQKSVRANDTVYDGIFGVPFGCAADGKGIDPNVHVMPEYAVPGSHCWSAPEGDAAFRITSTEVIPFDRADELPELTNEEYVRAQGYRYQIEVLGPGEVLLEPSGECAHFDRHVSVVDLMCGPRNSCSASLACMASECESCVSGQLAGCSTFEVPFLCHGGCAVDSCGPTQSCPSPLRCVGDQCVWDARP